MTIKSVICGSPDAVEAVYGEGRRRRVAELTDLYPHAVCRQNIDEHLDQLGPIEVIFATWGMPGLSEAHLDAMPKLRAVFYGAGSVQSFGRPLLARGIHLSSAWHTNGKYVAQVTLAQVLLACKGMFRNMRHCAEARPRSEAFVGPGIFNATVSILGAGAIGRAVIELLEPFELEVIVFDPFLSDADAAALGVAKVSLEDAFARGLVVSNHIADNEQTRGLIGREHFAAMGERATFINTGRPRTLDHGGLIDVLRQRPDLTAMLDVFESVPDEQVSTLRSMDNVFLSTHIAGAIGRERMALADTVIEQFRKWQAGKPTGGEVTAPMLATMA